MSICGLRDGVVTTLDLQKQQLIERRIADYIRGNRNRGIQNAAALLVDVRTMDVLAQIGSADFFNRPSPEQQQSVA